MRKMLAVDSKSKVPTPEERIRAKMEETIRGVVKIITAQLNNLSYDEWLPLVTIIAKAESRSWIISVIGPLDLNRAIKSVVIEYMRQKVAEWDEENKSI